MAERTVQTSPIYDLVEIRKNELGVTQNEVARQLGVSPATLTNWSRGTKPQLDGDLIASICQFLAVSPREFFISLGWMGADPEDGGMTGSDSSCFLTGVAS